MYILNCLLLLLLLSRFSRVWPHRWQPTRLPRPWDSPGKNTGVGCHFLLQCMKVKSESEVAQSCPTLSDPMDPYQAPGSMGFSRQEYWSGVPLTSPLNCLQWPKKKKNLDLGHLVIYFSISNIICSWIYFILLTQHFILIHQIPVCLLNAWSQGQPENQEEFVGRIWGSLLLQFSFRFPPDILGAVLIYKLVCCFIWL